MANKIFSRNEFFFFQNETSYGVIPNTAGTATLAGTNACEAIQFKINRVTDEIVRKDKTGSRTARAGVAGRKIANFSMNMSLVTSGTPGTAPDCDPPLRSLFGAAPTAKTGTVSITGATNASPIVITATAHGMSNFDLCSITGVLGNTAANGIWAINNVTTNTFELVGSPGNTGVAAVYTSGGTVSKAALVYIPSDASPTLSFTGYSFRLPSTAAQRAIFGCVSKEGTFNLGEDIATWQNTGDAFWHNDSLNFANCTTQEAGGLTAFPVLPSGLVVNGEGIAGFKGRLAISGANQIRVRTVNIKYGSGLDLPRDLFGTQYVDLPEADERNIQVSFNLYEDDTAGQAALEQAAIDKTAVDLVGIVGTIPGNAYGMVTRGIHLASPDRDDSQRAFTLSYNSSRAYGVGLSTFDEMRLWAL